MTVNRKTMPLPKMSDSDERELYQKLMYGGGALKVYGCTWEHGPSAFWESAAGEHETQHSESDKEEETPQDNATASGATSSQAGDASPDDLASRDNGASWGATTLRGDTTPQVASIFEQPNEELQRPQGEGITEELQRQQEEGVTQRLRSI